MKLISIFLIAIVLLVPIVSSAEKCKKDCILEYCNLFYPKKTKLVSIQKVVYPRPDYEYNTDRDNPDAYLASYLITYSQTDGSIRMSEQVIPSYCPAFRIAIHNAPIQK